MRPGKSAEAGRENKLIEVRFGLEAVRALRTALIDLAYKVAMYPQKSGILILVDPGVTTVRLKEEWLKASQTLRPDVAKRLSIAVARNGHYEGLDRELTPEAQRALGTMVLAEGIRGKDRLPRPDYYYILLEILIHQWLKNKGPMTTSWLMKTAGCSYPTVAAALRRLRASIERHPNRRVELRRFPKDEWANLVAVSDVVRFTTRFADRSGQPRSPDDLLRRLKKLDRTDIAVGGTFGARHHKPDLDLHGNPRLDLSVHAPGKNADLDFVSKLDKGLSKVESSKESPLLVLHFVRRKESFFEPGPDGYVWADPVECLLDLHEARLESQALELLEHFKSLRE